MIVVDASALIEALTRTDKGLEVFRHLISARLLHAPHLLDTEVANVLRRAELRGAMTPAHAMERLQDFEHLAITLHAHRPLLPRIWSLRHAITAYDGAYVALAERLDAPLLTCDRRLAAAAGDHIRLVLV